MKSFLLLSCLTLCSLFSFGQKPSIVKFPYVESLLHSSNDTTYIINFWATWCKPCVKELPLFNELNEKYKGQKIKVILVSLDFLKDYETRLVPFLQNRNIEPEVVLLHEPDYNSWIDRVNPNWGGAIPATVIARNNSQSFLEGETTLKEIENILLKQ